MKNKNVLLLVLASLLIILIMQNVLAIGITPGRKTFNFEPGLHKEVSFSIINSEHKDMSVVFIVRGNLSESITLNQTYAEFSASEESKSFVYTVDLPQTLSIPGKHEAEIVALEMPKDMKEQGAFVGATIAVVSQLHIYVPYPGKYIEADINVIESAEGKKTIFLIPVINRGKLDIVNLKTIIDIYSGSGEKITAIESGAESLASLERKEIAIELEENINPGKYKAVATLLYDNEATIVSKEFNVGEMFLEIKKIIVEDFSLGEIAKFVALVENKWSSDLKDVYLNIIVNNDEGEVMADFKSPNYDITALSKSEMVAYWDTAGVKKGAYDGKLILKYGKKLTDKNMQMKITDDNIEITGLTGYVTIRKKGKFNLNNLLIVIIAFLILVNIAWFIIVKTLMKKKR